MNKVALGQVFLRVSGFPPSVSFNQEKKKQAKTGDLPKNNAFGEIG